MNNYTSPFIYLFYFYYMFSGSFDNFNTLLNNVLLSILEYFINYSTYSNYSHTCSQFNS